METFFLLIIFDDIDAAALAEGAGLFPSYGLILGIGSNLLPIKSRVNKQNLDDADK